MKNALIKLATHLDNKGYYREANYLDVLTKRAMHVGQDGKYPDVIHPFVTFKPDPEETERLKPIIMAHLEDMKDSLIDIRDNAEADDADDAEHYLQDIEHYTEEDPPEMLADANNYVLHALQFLVFDIAEFTSEKAGKIEKDFELFLSSMGTQTGTAVFASNRRSELIKLATHLDKKGHYKEADYLDALVKNNSLNHQG